MHRFPGSQEQSIEIRGGSPVPGSIGRTVLHSFKTEHNGLSEYTITSLENTMHDHWYEYNSKTRRWTCSCGLTVHASTASHNNTIMMQSARRKIRGYSKAAAKLRAALLTCQKTIGDYFL